MLRFYHFWLGPRRMGIKRVTVVVVLTIVAVAAFFGLSWFRLADQRLPVPTSIRLQNDLLADSGTAFVPMNDFEAKARAPAHLQSFHLGLYGVTVTPADPRPGAGAKVVALAPAPKSTPALHMSGEITNSFTLVDQEQAQLLLGQVAYNTPPSPKVDDMFTVQLLLDSRKTVDELKKSLTARGTPMGARVQLSDRMQATLTGAHFDIVPNDPPAQAVGSQRTVQWTWEVVPETDGVLTLYLTLSAVINVEGEPVPMVVQKFKKEIVVQVTDGQRLSRLVGNHWEWLLTTLAIPIGAWARRKWKRRGHTGRT